MSVRVTLNCLIKAESKTALFTFLKHNLPNVRRFNGCLSVNVLFNDECGEMLLDEHWQSVQHHQDYIAFIDNNGVLGELSAFLTEPPQIKYFEHTGL